MKKVFAAIAAFCLSTLALIGCAPSAITVTFDNPYPWSGTGYEKAVYEVTVYDFAGNNPDKVVAEGKYVTEIENNVETSDANISYGKVTNSFTIRYNEFADDSDKNKTDRIESYAYFQMNSLATRNSHREYVVEERDKTSSLFSYTVDMNYFDGNGSLVTYKGGKEEKSMLTFEKGTYYDNELLYYLTRAQALTLGGATNFFLTSPIDSFSANKLITYTMRATASKEYANRENTVNPDPFVIPEKPVEGVPEAHTPCYETTLSISSTKAGPPTFLYYAAYDAKYNGKINKKTLVYFYSRSYTGTTVQYETRYTLKSLAYEKGK